MEGIEYFRSLPYEHTHGVNIFTFHLLDVLYSANELATVELLIKSQIDSAHGFVGNHLFRYHEQLLRVRLYQGKINEVEALLGWMEKKGGRLDQPFVKERTAIYRIYLAILIDEKVSLRKMHYRLNRIPRSNVVVIAPFLIGKVIYHLVHSNFEKAEQETIQLGNYTKVYQDSISARSVSFIEYLKSIFDVRNIQVDIPKATQIPARQDCEIINYDLLREITDRVKVL